jgi:hypothetical protein
MEFEIDVLELGEGWAPIIRALVVLEDVLAVELVQLSA